MSKTMSNPKKRKNYQDYEYDFHNAIDINRNIRAVSRIIRKDLFTVEEKLDMHFNRIPNALKSNVLTRHYTPHKIAKIRDTMLGLIYNNQLQESDAFNVYIMRLIDYYKNILNNEHDNEKLDTESYNQKISQLVILIN